MRVSKLANFVHVPITRLQGDTLIALLEEYASRDGTDYGLREVTLQEKVAQLQLQLQREDIALLYDADSETWDLVSKERLAEMAL